MLLLTSGARTIIKDVSAMRQEAQWMCRYVDSVVWHCMAFTKYNIHKVDIFKSTNSPEVRPTAGVDHLCAGRKGNGVVRNLQQNSD